MKLLFHFHHFDEKFLDRVEYEVSPTLLHMNSTGTLTSDL